MAEPIKSARLADVGGAFAAFDDVIADAGLEARVVAAATRPPSRAPQAVAVAVAVAVVCAFFVVGADRDAVVSFASSKN